MTTPKKSFHLQVNLAPGDLVATTALVRDLHATYPDNRISIADRWKELFLYDTRVTPQTPDAVEVTLKFAPSIQKGKSDRSSRYIYAAHEAFEAVTGLPVVRGLSRPDVALGEDELTSPYLEPYAVVAAGVKGDIPAKQWPRDSFDVVVAATKEWNWKQIGRLTNTRMPHYHHVIPDAECLVGKTTFRQLARLIAHASVVLCHTSLPMMLASAFGVPCVAVGGGREAPWMFSDLGVTYLHTVGDLPCCKDTGCYVMATSAPHDGKFPLNWLCSDPVPAQAPGGNVGRCMTLLTPEKVLAALRQIHS